MAKAERTISTPGSDGVGKADGAREQRSGEVADDPGGSAGAAGVTGVDRPEPEADAMGEDTGHMPAPRGRRRIAVLLGVAAFAYVLDLFSKMIVVERLEGRRPIEIIGEYLQFEAVRNPGAAFGIGEALTVVFTLIAVTVIAVIARIARKLYSLPWAIALGLLLGGALGNLTDRLFRSPGVLRGHVVDFIAPKYFAVFNLADSAIVCGGILIVLLSFRGSSPDGTIHRD